MSRPTDQRIAEMLRNGASGIMSSHNEYCISSDGCSCYKESDEMLQAADELGGGTPEERQRSADEAVVAGVRGFPIFESEEKANQYFEAVERLSSDDPPAQAEGSPPPGREG